MSKEKRYPRSQMVTRNGLTEGHTNKGNKLLGAGKLCCLLRASCKEDLARREHRLHPHAQLAHGGVLLKAFLLTHVLRACLQRRCIHWSRCLCWCTLGLLAFTDLKQDFVDLPRHPCKRGVSCCELRYETANRPHITLGAVRKVPCLFVVWKIWVVRMGLCIPRVPCRVGSQRVCSL